MSPKVYLVKPTPEKQTGQGMPPSELPVLLRTLDLAWDPVFALTLDLAWDPSLDLVLGAPAASPLVLAE